MKVRVFETNEEMIKALESDRKAADEAAEPWQKLMGTGDYYVTFHKDDGLVVYGTIYKPESTDDQEFFRQPPRKNIRPVRGYSGVVPEGEYGTTHVSNMHMKISRACFEEAQAAGWPQEADKVAKLFAKHVPLETATFIKRFGMN